MSVALLCIVIYVTVLVARRYIGSSSWWTGGRNNATMEWIFSNSTASTSNQHSSEVTAEQDAYTLHKPLRRRFKRRCVVLGGWNQQWQADLVDFSNLKKDNDGKTFLLTMIDVFSKVAWCVPLKNKSAALLVAALEGLFTNAVSWPTTLQPYKGPEFLNLSVQGLLKKYVIHQFSTHNEETKASIIERFNQT